VAGLSLAPSTSKEFEMDYLRGVRALTPYRRACPRSCPSGALKRLILVLVIAVGAPLLALPAAAAAQQPAGVIVGLVTDGGGSPLFNAQVLVAGTPIHTLSQADGGFQLFGVPVGSQVLEVHFVGYQPFELFLELEPDQMVRVNLALELNPVKLDQVEANALRAMPAAIQGFYQRRSRAAGHFFTREQIGAMHPRAFTDILRRVPGANVRNVTGPQGGSQVVNMGRSTGASGSRSCDAVYFVNGMPFPVASDIGINAYIRPQDIEALEVYSGASRIPSEFNTGMKSSRCGVVVIWTRSGPSARSAGN
jgi:hypothetical protein